MQLSVVVPAFNVEDAIADTLRSLADLVPSPLEVIVIDDGSTDATRDKIDTFLGAHPTAPIRVLRQENQGVSVARNRGLDDAKGDYILFLDGDDTVDRELVRVLTESQSLDRVVDIVCWKFRHEKLELQGTPLEDAWGQIPALTTGPETLRRILVKQDHFIWTGSAAYRLDFLREHALEFTPGCASAQDVEFLWKALSLAGAVQFVNTTLSFYRFRNGSVTNVTNVRRFDGVLAYHRAAKFIAAHLDEADLSLAHTALDRVVPRFMGHFKLLARTHPGSAKQVVSEIELRNPGILRLISSLMHAQQGKQRGPILWSLFRYSPILAVRYLRARSKVTRRKTGVR